MIKIFKYKLTMHSDLENIIKAIELYEDLLKEEKELLGEELILNSFDIRSWKERELNILKKIKNELIKNNEFFLNEGQFIMLYPFISFMKK